MYEAEFAIFVTAYPVSRRVSTPRALAAFRTARRRVPFETLLAALEQHKRSVQWQKHIIPSLLTWLLEGRWQQILPETPPSAEDADRIRKRQTPWQHARRLGLK